MYFDSIPKILYDSKGNGEVKVVTNLLKRVAIRTKIKTNSLILDTYNVKNGETPESIADKLYDDPELHWVVLIPMNYRPKRLRLNLSQDCISLVKWEIF